MTLSSEQFHTLYDGAAQPVILVRDGAVAELNCHAQELFAVGTALRAYLPQDAALPEMLYARPAVLPVMAGGVCVSANTQPLDDALLLFLPPQDTRDELAAFCRAAQSISTPLTTLLSVSGTLFPLLSEAEDPAVQQNLAVLNRACYQLLRASENLTDLSYVQHGRLPLSLEKTDLTDFLDGLAQRADELCLQMGLAAGSHFRLDRPPTGAPCAAGAAVQRSQVLCAGRHAASYAHAARQARRDPSVRQRRGHGRGDPMQRVPPLRKAGGTGGFALRRGLQPACRAGDHAGARRLDPAAVAAGRRHGRAADAAGRRADRPDAAQIAAYLGRPQRRLCPGACGAFRRSSAAGIRCAELPVRQKRNKRTQSLRLTAKSSEGADRLPAAPSCCIECHAFLLPMAQHTPLIDIFRPVW